MKTAVHRIELLIIDHDACGADGVTVTLESTRYPNRCIAPRVMGVETREVEWSDEHPLNRFESMEVAYRALFRDERRVETGPLQVGDDWPGVFIRGDDAAGFAHALSSAIATLEWDRGGFLPGDPLSELLGLLTGSRSEVVGDGAQRAELKR